MSAAALPAAPPLRRARLAVILAFWCAAIWLFVGQALLLLGLGALDRNLVPMTGELLIPSPWWRIAGVSVTLLAAGTALVLQRRWLEGIWGDLAALALVPFVPFAAVCLLLAHYLGLRTLETTHLPSGVTVSLALDDNWTGIDFVLVEDVDPDGFVWRRIDVLGAIESGRFASPPQLAATPDGDWLLVRHRDIWTEAFRIVDGHPVQQNIELPPAPLGRSEESFLRLRSARIAALTGIRP